MSVFFKMFEIWEILFYEVVICIYILWRLYDKRKEAILMNRMNEFRNELDLLYEFLGKNLNEEIEKKYERIKEKVDKREGSTISDSNSEKSIETNDQKHKNILTKSRKCKAESTKKTFRNIGIGTMDKLNKSKKNKNVDSKIDSNIPHESSIERNTKIKNDLSESKSLKDKVIIIIDGIGECRKMQNSLSNTEINATCFEIKYNLEQKTFCTSVTETNLP